MPKIVRALAVVCTGGHDYVTLYPEKAKNHKELHDRHMHACRPHRIVRLVDVTSLVASLRSAMKRHGCKGKCDVCSWAAHVIGIIWKDA